MWRGALHSKVTNCGTPIMWDGFATFATAWIRGSVCRCLALPASILMGPPTLRGTGDGLRSQCAGPRFACSSSSNSQIAPFHCTARCHRLFPQSGCATAYRLTRWNGRVVHPHTLPNLSPTPYHSRNPRRSNLASPRQLAENDPSAQTTRIL